MSVNGRWKVPLGLAVLAAVAAGTYVAMDALRAPDMPEAPRASPALPSPAPSASRAEPPPLVPPPALAGVGSAVPRGKDGGLDLVGAATASVPPAPEEGAPVPSPVDLEKIRAKLPPDNLFWETGAPTKDEEVLRKRTEAERQWNDVFGRVQSGEATEAEIHRYYDYRRKLSEDYIAVAQAVLGEYGDTLPDQERGLYELSIQMHTTRLQEMPRKVEEALARREAQAQRQREWKQGGGGN